MSVFDFCYQLVSEKMVGTKVKGCHVVEFNTLDRAMAEFAVRIKTATRGCRITLMRVEGKRRRLVARGWGF